MSTAYNNHKKAKRRQIHDDIVNMEFGNDPPEYLWDKYPGQNKAYILAGEKARVDFQSMIKRMIRRSQISRYVMAKNGQGKILANGTYKTKDGTKFKVKNLIQKFIGFELMRKAQEQHRGK